MVMKIIFLSGTMAIKNGKLKRHKYLMPIIWHPSRWWDWCMSEDEKKETEKLWDKYRPFLCMVTGYKNIFLKGP